MSVSFFAPSKPPSVHYISEQSPSVYLIGNDTFTVGNFPVTTIFHRRLTNFDDFVLGALSVLIIALITEITQTLLLRTTNRRMSLNRVLHAVLISEITHFRNLSRHFVRSRRVPNSVLARSSSCISLAVIVIAALLFAADVIIVVLTQPIITRSKGEQFTLEAVHPVTTDTATSAKIYHAVAHRPCITPVMPDAPQSRNFVIVACISITEQTTEPSVSVLPNITIASWFHPGGADHTITTPKYVFKIRARAQIIMDIPDGGSRRLIFHVNDTSDYIAARYLHVLTMHAALKWACQSNESIVEWCVNIVNSESLHSPSWQTTVKEISYWNGRNNNTLFNIAGVESFFPIDFPNAAVALRIALHPLVSSGAIFEKISVDHATFTRVINDSDYTSEIEGLIQEEGRPAGIIVLVIIVSCLFLLLMVLRAWLKPVSLGMLAINGVQHVEDDILFVRDEPSLRNLPTESIFSYRRGTPQFLENHDRW